MPSREQVSRQPESAHEQGAKEQQRILRNFEGGAGGCQEIVDLPRHSVMVGRLCVCRSKERTPSGMGCGKLLPRFGQCFMDTALPWQQGLPRSRTWNSIKGLLLGCRTQGVWCKHSKRPPAVRVVGSLLSGQSSGSSPTHKGSTSAHAASHLAVQKWSASE